MSPVASDTAAPPTGPPRTEQIRAEQIRALYENIALGVVGALAASLILAAVLLYFGEVSRIRVFVWFAATLVSAGWQLFICYRYKVARPPANQWKKWADRFTVASLGEGLRWGLGSIWLAAPNHLDEQLWVIMVVSSASAASVSSIGAYLPAFYSLMFGAMLPFGLWSLAQGDIPHLALSLLDFVFMAAVAALAKRSNRHLVEALKLRFENVALVDDLRQQKELAERASMEKSYFLAAASHDLRQPVHALSLLIGALQSRPMSADAQDLVEQIQTSVGAMDQLFHALLDMAQLDAGTIQPSPQAFPLRLLLERLCADYAAEAADKGIRLVLHSSALSVYTDPALLERVLRNLISNAVRYTQKGRVVVGCRRRGDTARVEVWDTGPGIASDQQKRIFQEFYQVENPERDRAKGLGLGLAIVRRVTTLLACPLSFASTPGHGSVFKVAIPIAGAASAAVQPTHDDLRPDRHGLILIVDDELAIQQAMRSLLSSWGHEVFAAGSYAELFAALAEIRKCPDLIICDYRLRDGESGLDVIRKLRLEFNEDIPAMLITGDTAPDRVSEARASGFVVLYKPIASSKLRAAIGNLMRKSDSVTEGS